MFPRINGPNVLLLLLLLLLLLFIIKLKKLLQFFSSFNPYPSLPSVATGDRKQFQYLNIVLINKTGPLLLESN